MMIQKLNTLRNRLQLGPKKGSVLLALNPKKINLLLSIHPPPRRELKNKNCNKRNKEIILTSISRKEKNYKKVLEILTMKLIRNLIELKL